MIIYFWAVPPSEKAGVGLSAVSRPDHNRSRDAAAIPHAIKETSSSKAGTKIGEIPLFGRVNRKKWRFSDFRY